MAPPEEKKKKKVLQVAHFKTTPESTWTDKLVGLYCISSFIVIWISSLLSPFFFINAIRNKHNVIAATIVIITILAYIPWKRGYISRSVSFLYNRYHPCYYKESSITFEESIPSDDQRSFFAVHPHGAFCIGWAQLFCSPYMERVKFCFAPALYASPFFRLFSRTVGNPGSAARDSMISYMKTGTNDIALPPGGFEEATLSSLHHDRVYIKKRTGFVKLCLMHGYAIRPVYVFGERNLYWNIQGMWSFRFAMNKYGLPSIVTWGNPIAPLLPKNTVKVHIVVGAPLVLPKIDNPSKDDVKTWHNKYITALLQLFEDHKEDAYGEEAAKTAKLEIW